MRVRALFARKSLFLSQRDLTEQSEQRVSSIIQLEYPPGKAGLRALARLNMSLTFRYFLRKGAYRKDDFPGLISRTPFKDYDIKEVGISLDVYLRK